MSVRKKKRCVIKYMCDYVAHSKCKQREKERDPKYQ